MPGRVTKDLCGRAGGVAKEMSCHMPEYRVQGSLLFESKSLQYWFFHVHSSTQIVLREYPRFLKKKEVNMATGTVKWFNDAKGFGFVTPDGGGDDLFAHFSAINMNGFKTLQEGQKVTFEVTQGPKGKQASNIQAA
jgi:CspA family cold shock protein